MRVTCLNNHDVCSCPDGLGWELHAKNFTNWNPNQRQIEETDRIWHIASVAVSEQPLAGKCWCGAPYAGKDHNNIFRIHTAQGWLPEYEDESDNAEQGAAPDENRRAA